MKAVAGLFPTAIISGRGREKVMGFVKLQELFYAGSHGMDIVGPSVSLLLTATTSEDFLVIQVSLQKRTLLEDSACHWNSSATGESVLAFPTSDD